MMAPHRGPRGGRSCAQTGIVPNAASRLSGWRDCRMNELSLIKVTKAESLGGHRLRLGLLLLQRHGLIHELLLLLLVGDVRRDLDDARLLAPCA
jgi:hypothetical protein